VSFWPLELNSSPAICPGFQDLASPVKICFFLDNPAKILYDCIYNRNNGRVRVGSKKSAKNPSERGLSFADAEAVFSGPCVTFEDMRFDYGEPRFITFGLLEVRLVVIAHTPRGENIRIFSMWKANDREQKIYRERLEAARRDA
jgi:uncharacterized DUF497 family protein